MIDRYSKQGVLQRHQIDETMFDLAVADPATGLSQLGRSQTLHGRADDAEWSGIYVQTTDLP